MLTTGKYRGALLKSIGAIACLSVLACKTSHPVPDLGSIYDQAAKHHHEFRNPAIVIPGILGTRLTDPVSGRTVWGAFGGGAANPQKPDGALLAALPMREGATFDELRDDVVPDGVLDKLQVRMAGLPFQLKAYFQILVTLGVGGYRDQSLGDSGAINYGSEHFTCFQFDYDWRRDNVENAHRLHRFMLEKRAYVIEERRRRYGQADSEVKFDVIAHSMGGLITRYLLRYGTANLPEDGSSPELTWAGSQLVERAILVGTPNAGAMEALVQLVEGRKFGPLTPKYESALLGTYPSIYQLLPRVRHGGATTAGAHGEKLDFMDPKVWEKQGWGLASPNQDRVLQLLLPNIADPAKRRRIALDHQRKSLARARQFHAAIDRPASPPPGTDLYLVAGDAVDTLQTVAADPSSGKLEVLTHGPGDGTVLRSSALMDERVGRPWTPNLQSPIDWTHVTFMFSDHLGMTRDPSFSDNVLYLLLEAQRDRQPRSGD